MIDSIINSLFNLVYYLGYFALVLGVVILAALFFFQNKLLYMPVVPGLAKSPSQNPYAYRSPVSLKLEHEDVTITSSDSTKIKGWFIKCPDAAQRTVVFFHENAGNIGTRLPYIRQYIKRTSSHVLIVAYRGYSDSEGTPTQKGIKLDSLAIVQFAFRHPANKQIPIYFHGRSLGGAVAAYASTHSDFKPKAVILECTFTSIDDMVGVLFGYLKYVKKPILRNFWRTVQLIPKMSMPLMFIKAELDELVPIQHMNMLATLAKKNDQKIRQYTVEGGTHNSTWDVNPREYFEQIRAFFAQCESKGSAF